MKEKSTFKNRNNLLFTIFFTFHLREIEKTQMGNCFAGRDVSNSWLEKKIVRDRRYSMCIFPQKNPLFAGLPSNTQLLGYRRRVDFFGLNILSV